MTRPDEKQQETSDNDPSLDSERESDVLYARREAKEDEADDAREARAQASENQDEE